MYDQAYLGITFKPMPGIKGVKPWDPDGAYLWGGNAEVGGRYQVIVIGPRKADEHYRDAAHRALGCPVAIERAEMMDGADEKAARELQRRGGFRSIILAPVEQKPLVPAVNIGVINSRDRHRAAASEAS